MALQTTSFGKRGIAAPQTRTASVRAARAEARVAVAHPPGRLSLFAARIPWLTLVISFILCTRFDAELRNATDFTARNAPGHFTLLAMGGADRAQVFGQGEYWRLFTASALHGSPAHLAGNIVTLLIVGVLLEPLIGIGWFAAIYFTGAFCGQLFSTLMNGADTLSVGASGAIMATLAALFCLSFHSGAKKPGAMRRMAISSIFPALLPNVSHGAITDINAHMGGFLAGTAIAMVLLAAWSNEEEPHPPGRSIAAVIAGGWVALTVWAFITGTQSFAHYAKGGLDYIPPDALPREAQVNGDAALRLVERYPNDPRSHLYRGLYFMQIRQYADGEPYLRDAVRMGESSAMLTTNFKHWSLSLLALDILAQGHADEARKIAAPLCALGDVDAPTQKVLTAGKLCA